MKKLFALLAFPLLGAAGPGAAQSPAPQPSATPSVQPPANASQPNASQPTERKPLILHLDDASRRQILFGPGGSQSTEGATRASDGLPSLGGDARRVDPATLRNSSSPYPKHGNSDTPGID
jgi:hypothetical protein